MGSNEKILEQNHTSEKRQKAHNIGYCRQDNARTLSRIYSQFFHDEWYRSSGKAGYNEIDHDIILLWGDTKKVITGSDILGRLLQGIIGKKNSTEGQLMIGPECS